MRRWLTITLDLLLVLVGAVLGLATNYAANVNNGLPHVLELLRSWSIPLAGALVVLLLAGRFWQSILERPPTPADVWDPARSPFPGLEPFAEDESATFFGRDNEIRVLYDRLHPAVPGRSGRLVPVVGPSGCGKSSLVQAGLLPRLTARRGRWAVLPTTLPTQRPLRSLARTLSVASARDVEEVYADLEQGPGPVQQRLEQFRARATGRDPSVLLVIDQAEELLTLAPEADRVAFLRLLSDVLASTGRLWVVMVFRTEFLADFLQTEYASLFQQPVTVGPLGRAALIEVIERPAARAGIGFEPPSLVHRMADDTGTGDALPLLAYCLQQLWQQVGKGQLITEAHYEQLGGVAGTLGRRAQEVTDQLQQAGDDRELVLRTLVKFVTTNGTTPTRRRVKRKSLSAGEGAIADAFVAARLLTAATDPGSGEAVVYVTHEALIERWVPLRQRVEARMADLQIRARLERWAQEWVDAGRTDDYLLSGERLSSARRWAEADQDALIDTPVLREYVQRSERADHASATWLADAVATRALAAVARLPELALSAALTAIREYVATPLACQVLIASLAVSHLERILRGHAGPLTGVAWSPCGPELATASADGSVRIWPGTDGAAPTVLRGPGAGVNAVAWASDGKRVAAASADGAVRIWDVRGGLLLATLKVSGAPLAAVAWSPDAGRLAVTGEEPVVSVWDVAGGVRIGALAGHEGPIRAVAWSPDGARLATGSDDWSVRIWDVAEGVQTGALTGHEGPVRAVAWSPSPDGARLATASDDWSVRIWDVAATAQISVLEHHDDAVCALAWSADGGRIASGGGDGSLVLWNVPTTVADEARPLSVLSGHDGAVVAAAWSPDRARIVSASADGTARVWSSRLTALKNGGRTRAVAWSPNGRLLATTSEGVVRIWDAVRGDPFAVLSGHGDRVAHLAWSPDGCRLATTSVDRVVRVWDATAGFRQLRAFTGQEGQGTWISWSPDSARVACASMDCTVRIWRADTDEPAEVRRHAKASTWTGWSPDGSRFAVVLWDGTVHIEQTGRPDTEFVVRAHETDVWGAGWSPDGTRLATASYDHTIRIWNAADGAEEAVLRGHEDAVFGVAWSPVPGGWLASVGRDRTVRLWDVAGRREIAVLRGHEDAIWALAWSCDGTRLATGSEDGVIRLWDVFRSYEAALIEAERLELRPLTSRERERFQLPAEPAADPLEPALGAGEAR